MSKERIWYPISDIYIIRPNLTNFLSDVEQQHKTFLEAKKSPYSMDDALVARMHKSVIKQSKDIKLYDEQIQKWATEATKKDDKQEVKRLGEMVDKLHKLNKELLEICDYLKDKTIENVTNMSDAELALKAMVGNTPFSTKKKH